MIRKTFKYRLYPTKQQIILLEWTLARCQELYNAALQERRDAWRINLISVVYNQQAGQLREIKNECPEYKNIHAQVLQDVLRRVDKNFRRFFSCVKRGEKAGYPRFRSHSRYNSFVYPQNRSSAFTIESSKLKISKIGRVRIKLHRPIEGIIKTLTIKRETGRWYACFSVQCETRPLQANTAAVGIDVGLTSFVTLSDGLEIENPRWHKEAKPKLRCAQRKLARRRNGSHRRYKALLMLQRACIKIRYKRADFQHKLARHLVNIYGFIAVEDLNVKGMAGGMLAKSVLDAGWSSFINKLSYKAEEAGGQLVKVNPRGTSQKCLCGANVPKTLKERWHKCPSCGLSASRDHVSAQLILRLGLSLCALT
jgi:putative transposase